MTLYALDGEAPALGEGAWVAPDAAVIGAATLGEEASVWFGAVVRADNGAMTVGARSNVQDGATLHSDPGQPLTLGEEVTVGHRAILHGCTIGDRVLVGMGAVVLNGASVGDESLVGAGALVTEGKVFAPRSLILGSPARAVRTLTDEEVAELALSAAVYVDKARRYAAGLAAA